MLRFLTNCCILVWFSFLLAAVLQMHRPADWSQIQGLDAAPENTAGKQGPPALLDRMEQAVFRRNAELQISETELNRYLATSLEGRQTFATLLGTRFDRVALDLEAGESKACFSWKGPFGLVSTATLNFTIDRRGGQFIIEPRHGRFGRLPLPRGILCTLLPPLNTMTKGLEVEIYTVFQMNKIRFEKDRLILDPRSEALK
ncbi:hypothetical protein [Verrucomicrobium sp. BvORR106]|uniref:hypothetical protein n=1 Tax=Verrucomicrobium sp. BvORR106 TaxID=1403819 RepID=UPI002240E9E1|nr:hypothetical protein [Verrucomicrobium sp. BvORR106]